ncbi:hypothetical protein LEP1GSC170_2221 [Leptospira interrogans serovar Bataviae str. HAI135]|nr:hypothetical protein LEP1GSC170_2221 [Leptospira interrogans serovar Bataviae str. HAI135]
MVEIFDIQKDHVEILNTLYLDFALPGAVLFFLRTLENLNFLNKPFYGIT